MKSWNSSTTGFLQNLHSNAIFHFSSMEEEWPQQIRLLKRRSWLRCPWRRKAWRDGQGLDDFHPHFKGDFDAELVKWLNQDLNNWDPLFAKMSVIHLLLGTLGFFGVQRTGFLQIMWIAHYGYRFRISVQSSWMPLPWYSSTPKPMGLMVLGRSDPSYLLRISTAV